MTIAVATSRARITAPSSGSLCPVISAASPALTISVPAAPISRSGLPAAWCAPTVSQVAYMRGASGPAGMPSTSPITARGPSSATSPASTGRGSPDCTNARSPLDASATLSGVRIPGGPTQSTPAPARRAVSIEPRSSWQTGATSTLRRPSREQAIATLHEPPGATSEREACASSACTGSASSPPG